MTEKCIKTLKNNGWTTLQYYRDGKLHRDSGPAYISYTPEGQIAVEEFYQEGKLHRDDGPAYIAHIEGSGTFEKYYKNGVEINPRRRTWIDDGLSCAFL